MYHFFSSYSSSENTRFFTVPSTGAALLLVNEINRENMGLTLDVGHMLMAGVSLLFILFLGSDTFLLLIS